jgi:hypothetical protein
VLLIGAVSETEPHWRTSSGEPIAHEDLWDAEEQQPSPICDRRRVRCGGTNIGSWSVEMALEYRTLRFANDSDGIRQKNKVTAQMAAEGWFISSEVIERRTVHLVCRKIMSHDRSGKCETTIAML